MQINYQLYSNHNIVCVLYIYTFLYYLQFQQNSPTIKYLQQRKFHDSGSLHVCGHYSTLTLIEVEFCCHSNGQRLGSQLFSTTFNLFQLYCGRRNESTGENHQPV